MSLHLDPRQRAMLLEMGVRVWQPDALLPTLPEEDAATLAQNAPERIAATALSTGASASFAEKPLSNQRFAPPPAIAAPAVPPAPPAPRQSDARLAPPPPARPLDSHFETSSAHDPQSAWLIGAPSPLYAETARAGAARWLVLAQTPAAALQGLAFDGQSGKLLDNMLRAARLHQAGAVLHVPLVRLAARAPSPEVLAEVAALVSQFRPDVVLVMGRFASQALLASSEAFGRVRGSAQALYGAPAVATFDADYLLRHPAYKAGAWADLCLAMRLAPLAGSG